jgi:hypothetical protein
MGVGTGRPMTGAVSKQNCSYPLVRFAAMNDIKAVRPIVQGKDEYFPASPISIAPAGANCGDSAHNIFQSCDIYNSWESMDSISKRHQFSFNVFDPSTGMPLHSDVQQGQLGTCYFLAAIASIAYRAPQIIADMFERRVYWKQGIISTKWLINGMVSMVEVDKMVPSRGGRPYFATLCKDTGAWWPAILEKAWSKIYGSYKAAEAGYWSVAASAITRAPTVTYYHKRLEKDELWQVLIKASQNSWPMGASTSSSYYGLAAGHAYSVLEAWQDPGRGKLVKVRNPWHTNYYKGSQPNPNFGDDSGIFTMSFDEFWIAFSSTSLAKVAPSYKLSTRRVFQATGSIQASFTFTVKSRKWFAVSIVWPNHRMLCKVAKPNYLLAVRKYGENTVFTPEPKAYGDNAAYIEIPAGAGGGAGTYSVALSADFMVDTFIHEVQLNIYAAETVDIYTPPVDYASLVLGMVGPDVNGAACDTAMLGNRGLWRVNKANQVFGVPTYDSWDGKNFAYYVQSRNQWFLISKTRWEQVKKGALWSFARLAKKDFLCGCRDATSVGGFRDVGCSAVRAPNVKYSNVRCDADVRYKSLVEAFCPVTCGLSVCNIPLR